MHNCSNFTLSYDKSFLWLGEALVVIAQLRRQHAAAPAVHKGGDASGEALHGVLLQLRQLAWCRLRLPRSMYGAAAALRDAQQLGEASAQAGQVGFTQAWKSFSMRRVLFEILVHHTDRHEAAPQPHECCELCAMSINSPVVFVCCLKTLFCQQSALQFRNSSILS